MNLSGKTNGFKSSELWISLAGMIGGILCAIFSDSQWAQVGGPILTAICGASYTQSRATVKKALAGAEALKEASSTVGKSEEPPKG